MKHSVNSDIPISIVICTQNRADLLSDLLETICRQDLPAACYEVLIVDNDSKDRTRLVAEDYCRKYDNMRYFMELRHGLSYARNRGWIEARGEYVGYVDDDCKVPSQWLTVARDIIERVSPAVFGGPAYPFYNSQKPYWWKENYGIFEHSSSPRALDQSEFLMGCNFFVRRGILKDVRGFDITLGMTGQHLGYGEETEFQRRLRETAADQIIYYEPKLFVYHLVRPEQMSLRWNLNSRFVVGRYSYYVFQDDKAMAAGPSKPRLLARAILILLRLFLDIIFGFLRRDRGRYPYFQNYLYENTFEYVSNFGVIYEKHSLCR